MRTYLIVSGDFSMHGGMDRANYELALYLADTRRAPVHLVSHFVSPTLANHPNIIVHRVSRPLNSNLLGAPLLARKGRQISRGLGEDTRVIVNGGNCPIAAVNWVHAVHAAWNTRDAHASFRFRVRNKLAKRAARRNEKKALQAARMIITNSETARRQITDRLGLPPERIHVVYLAADVEKFRPYEEAEKMAARRELNLHPTLPVAVFIGALGHDRNKGFDLLFGAWKKLCETSDWDVTLVAIGGGAEVDLWRKHAAEARLASRMQILGPRQDVPRILGAADVLVSPTFYDAYGLGVHEALCCGLPVIVSRSAGVTERFVGDMKELLLDSPPDIAQLVERLWHWRRRIDKFKACDGPLHAQLRADSWKRMARQIEQMIEDGSTEHHA